MAAPLRLSSDASERNVAVSVNGKSSKFVLHLLSCDTLYNDELMQNTFVALSVNLQVQYQIDSVCFFDKALRWMQDDS